MINFNQILPRLYVGSCPEGVGDIERLINDCHITAVLNLQTDTDLLERVPDWPALEASYKNLHIELERIPMGDFDSHDQRRRLPQAVKSLTKQLASGHTTYLHCNAGAGRSPLVAMAYLYWCRNLGLEEAINHVKQCRRCAPYEELLELSRQDLLEGDDIQSRISHRATQISQERQNTSHDARRCWTDAEREVLRELLASPPEWRGYP